MNCLWKRVSCDKNCASISELRNGPSKSTLKTPPFTVSNPSCRVASEARPFSISVKMKISAGIVIIRYINEDSKYFRIPWLVVCWSWPARMPGWGCSGPPLHSPHLPEATHVTLIHGTRHDTGCPQEYFHFVNVENCISENCLLF